MDIQENFRTLKARTERIVRVINEYRAKDDVEVTYLSLNKHKWGVLRMDTPFKAHMFQTPDGMCEPGYLVNNVPARLVDKTEDWTLFVEDRSECKRVEPGQPDGSKVLVIRPVGDELSITEETPVDGTVINSY